MFSVHLYNSNNKQNVLTVNKGESREILGGITMGRLKGDLTTLVRLCMKNEMGRAN